MQRLNPTRRAARGPLTDPRTAEHPAAPPTEPDRFDPALVKEGVGLRLEERIGLEPADIRTEVAAVARALWGATQDRATAYERALRALPASWGPVLEVDFAALALVDEAVAFGARIGWALASLPAPAGAAPAEAVGAWLEAVCRLAETPTALPKAV